MDFPYLVATLCRAWREDKRLSDDQIEALKRAAQRAPVAELISAVEVLAEHGNNIPGAARQVDRFEEFNVEFAGKTQTVRLNVSIGTGREPFAYSVDFPNGRGVDLTRHEWAAIALFSMLDAARFTEVGKRYRRMVLESLVGPLSNAIDACQLRLREIADSGGCALSFSGEEPPTRREPIEG